MGCNLLELGIIQSGDERIRKSGQWHQLEAKFGEHRVLLWRYLADAVAEHGAEFEARPDLDP